MSVILLIVLPFCSGIVGSAMILRNGTKLDGGKTRKMYEEMHKEYMCGRSQSKMSVGDKICKSYRPKILIRLIAIFFDSYSMPSL